MFNSEVQQEERGLIVTFEDRPKLDKAATDKEGRQAYKMVEYINIRIPGSRDSVSRPVTEQDKMRFKARYDNWVAKKTPATDGVPLEEWPMVSVSQIHELKAVNIFTVEQLASVSDGHLINLGIGGRTLRDKAIAYLGQSKDVAFAATLQKENSILKKQLEIAEQNIRDLASRIDAIQAGKTDISKPIADGEADEDVKQPRKRAKKHEEVSIT